MNGFVIFMFILVSLLFIFFYKLIKSTPDEYYEEIKRQRGLGNASNNVFVDYSDAVDEHGRQMKDINARFPDKPAEPKKMTPEEKVEWDQWLADTLAKQEK